MINIFYDTNILFNSGDRGYDFSTFKLNSRFNNIVDKIENLDCTDKVRILLPEVVFEELKKQQVDAYEQEYRKLKGLINQFKSLPNIDIKEVEEIDYEDYLTKEKELFLKKLEKYFVKVELLKLPSKERFHRIIQRAYAKKAPFEGKEKKSDKGFKDALLWESLLEFAEENKEEHFILYSVDKKFEEVQEEFSGALDKDLLIAKNEKDILAHLQGLLAIKELEKTEEQKIYDKIEDYLFMGEGLGNVLEGNEYGEGYIISAQIGEIFDIQEINDFTFSENFKSYLVKGRGFIVVQDGYNEYEDCRDERFQIELIYSLEYKEFRINLVEFESAGYGFSTGIDENGKFVDY